MSFQLNSRTGSADEIALVTMKNVLTSATKAGAKGKRVHGAPPIVSFLTSDQDKELRHEGIDFLAYLPNGATMPLQVWTSMNGMGHFKREQPRSRKYGPIVAVLVKVHMTYRKAKRFILKQLAQKNNSDNRVRQTLKHINRIRDGVKKAFHRKLASPKGFARYGHRGMQPSYA